MAIIFLLIKTIIQRFLEIFFSCTALSAVITAIYITDVVTTNDTLCFAIITGVIIFIAMNVARLRQCYFDWTSKLLYFLINISAYLLFAILSFVVYAFSNEWFTWMFAITKFVRYSNAALATHYSALLFHLLGILMILFAPAKMNWVFESHDEGGSDKYYESYEDEL